MKHYVESQLIRRSEDFVLLVGEKTKYIRKYKSFLDAMREELKEITALVELSQGCYNSVDRIDYYKRALKSCEDVLFYARLFNEYRIITDNTYRMIKCHGGLLSGIFQGLLKSERKNEIKEKNILRLNFVK